MDTWLTGLEPISVDGAAVTPPCRVFWVEGGPDETLEGRQPGLTVKMTKSSMNHDPAAHMPKLRPSSAPDWLLGKFPGGGVTSHLVEALQRHKLVQGWNVLSNQRHSDSPSSSSSSEGD